MANEGPTDDGAEAEETEAIARLLRPQLKRLQKELKKSTPELKSGQSERLHPNLSRVRWWLAVLVPVVAAIALTACYYITPIMCWLSVLSVASSTFLLILLCIEILSGAGTLKQSQYVVGNTTYREMTFKPSISAIYPIIGIVVLGITALALGYAGIYSYLSQPQLNHFGAKVSELVAICYSVFTMTSYGDMQPRSTLGYLVIGSQLMVSWSLTVFVISTLVAWGLTQQSDAVQGSVRERRKKMLRLENAMKKAQVGLYSKRKKSKELYRQIEK